MEPDPDRIDQVVLASLWLTAHRERAASSWSAWKTHDRDTLNRLHEAGFIDEPRNRRKSITFSEAGAEAARAAFESLCGGEPGDDRDKIVPMPGQKLPPSAPERHPFPPSAIRLWESVSESTRELILAQVWCGHCRGPRPIVDFTGIPDENGDLILRGFCAECGHVIVRVVETGDAFPQP